MHTLCLLISTSLWASIAAVTSKAGAPDMDLSGLADSLKNGGAEGLLKALSAVRASHTNNDANFKIKRDANGQAMYDFVPDTTQPPATTAPLPPPPTVATAPPTVAAATPAVSEAAPEEEATGAPAAQPVASQPVAAFTSGGGGGNLQALAAGLASIRQQVDALSAQADAASRGAPMVAIGAPVGFQAEGEIQGLLRRVEALEAENKKLHQQVDAQGSRLHKMEEEQQTDEHKLGNLTAQQTALNTALLARKRRRQHKKAQATAL